MMNTISQTVPLEITATSSVSCQTDSPETANPNIPLTENLNKVNSDRKCLGDNSTVPQKDENNAVLNKDTKQENKPKWTDKNTSRSSLSLRELLKSSKLGGYKEETVTMISSVGNESDEEEDEDAGDYYGDASNAFSDSDVESLGAAAGFEWDPDNRGNI